MSNPKKHFIFIIQNDQDELYAGDQSDVDNAIKYADQANDDIDFKVIGKIAEPNGPRSLPIDFNEQLIQWYEEGTKDKAFMKRAVLAIVNFIN